MVFVMVVLASFFFLAWTGSSARRDRSAGAGK
jgi:hypothetical protein